MKCALCHETDGQHTEACPQRIRVAWTSTGSIWERLARELFDAYENESPYDTNPDWCAMIRDGKRAIEDGDAFGALQLLRKWTGQKTRG